MPFNPYIHNRRSIRLKGYDYSACGDYFLTLTLHERIPRFGTIHTQQIQHTKAGIMVAYWLGEIPRHFANMALDEHVVMPDHVHMILSIKRHQPTVTIGRAVQWFKTMTTNAYLHGIRDTGWPTYDKRLWHRDYYEHIVRDTDDLQRIQRYIADNPRRA